MRKPDTASTSSRALTTACSPGHRTRLRKKASHNVNIFHAIWVSRTGTGICAWEEVQWERIPTVEGRGNLSRRRCLLSWTFSCWMSQLINSTPLLCFLSLCWPRVSTFYFVKPRNWSWHCSAYKCCYGADRSTDMSIVGFDCSGCVKS